MTLTNITDHFDVLLIEDRPADARAVRGVLEDSEVVNRLHTIGDAVEGMAYLRKEGPYRRALDADLVLLSAGLDGDDAARVLETIARDARLRCVPVVVMVDPEAMESFDRTPACAVIPKPLTLDRFVEALSAVIQTQLAQIEPAALHTRGRTH